ncbi:thioredoxin domain-containing protein [Georgenia satyanarayanai]|uniref:DsbA family protein n=1 Tax=Georgenia satyanarayanai TaxID=860221 RepID=UPI00203D6218|nr:thioredoxin domain-containing protein [Georgenia satyanarayanai]MCM3661372.1 thioredoxin domain-containing protein [Georgenia satyanarayanai]
MSSSTGRRAPWLVPVLIVVVAALLVAASVLVSGRGRDTADDAGAGATPAADVVMPEEPPQLDLARRETGDPLATGPVDAPVSLVVYSDYQCQFCAAWSADTSARMLEYAAAGDLRIEFRDIAIFGEESERAARAAYAAGLQGRYLDYQATLFPEGTNLPPRGLRDPELVAKAEELGLDVDRFTADLGSAEVAAAVQRNVDEAAAIGAFSTPAFLLDGRPLIGAQPTEVFVGAVEQALAEAR